jgi:negative regulator of replication initiation
MKSIKIDEDVYTYLQKKAIAFEEDPNDVLRRIFSRHHSDTPQENLSSHITIRLNS